MFDRPPTRLLSGSTLGLLVAAAVVVLTIAGVGAFAVDAGASSEDGNDDTRGNATALQMNSTVNDTIDGPNDTDWYAVEVGDSKRLLAGVTPNDTSGGGEDPPQEYKDVSITVYGPDGERVAHAETSMGGTPKTDAGVNHAVESGDTYYVRVESRYGDEAENPEAEEANGSQDYELDVESVGLDPNEPNDEPANATNFSTGETVSRNIVRTESDRYAVELDDGENVTVTYEVTARLNHNGAAMPTKTTVVNPDGEEIAGSEPIDDEGPDTVSYTYTANQSGTYLVTATANTDEMAVSGVRGNDLTQYDLRLDVADGSPDGNESTATPTETPPGEDNSDADGGQDTEEPEGTNGDAGDQPASDHAADDYSDDSTAAPPATPTAASTGTPATAPTGTDVPAQTETPVDPTQTAQATPTRTADQPAVTATEAPGQPGFGFSVAISSVFIAAITLVRHHRRSGK